MTDKYNTIPYPILVHLIPYLDDDDIHALSICNKQLQEDIIENPRWKEQVEFHKFRLLFNGKDRLFGPPKKTKRSQIKDKKNKTF